MTLTWIDYALWGATKLAELFAIGFVVYMLVIVV